MCARKLHKIKNLGLDHMRLRATTGNGAGLWLNNQANTATLAFIGTESDNQVGFFSNTKSWSFVMNTATGNVGIGTTSPHAPLQFSNGVSNRKIVLHEGADNDH